MSIATLWSNGDQTRLDSGFRTSKPPNRVRTHDALDDIRRTTWRFFAIALSFFLPVFADAVAAGTVQGRVADPLGASVSSATVTLLRNDVPFGSTTTDAAGAFAFPSVEVGRYRVRVTAEGFAETESAIVAIGSEETVQIEVLLRVGLLRQQIVVSDTGTELPLSQIGASVSVLDRETVDTLNKLDVLETLRLSTGAQIVQVGQRGGAASLLLRGGDANFNKVLVDGVPVNDVGGRFDFARLTTSGIESVEILRGPNSVLYGADALSSVVNVSTRRGRSAIPELTYSFDGGNFRTLRQDVSLAGAYRRFDYFSEFSRFDTRNGVPNSSFHNATSAGNFGLRLNSTSDVRATARHTVARLGTPNAIALYGIPDDSSQRDDETYLSATAQNQTTTRWRNLARFAFSQFRSVFSNPSPTGEPFDPFGFGNNYLGSTTTIRGANGYSVTGAGILDFGAAYPQTFPSSAARRSLYAQSDYDFLDGLSGTLGFRYEHENGSGITRDNYSYFLQARGSLGYRAYLTAGVGLENNALFGFAASPRVSAAYYVRAPSSRTFFGDTKLRFNFGKAIKEPAIIEETSSLHAVLTPELISQYGVTPIGAERNRAFDFGVEQGLWNGRARLGVTFFHNRFYDLIAFLNQTDLVALGVAPAVAAGTPFGAYTNAESIRARGLETEFEADLGHGLRLEAAHTYLDAIVTETFTRPAVGTAFPEIPIGAFAPLKGARPFRRAPHSGSFVLSYFERKLGMALSGYFVGRRDDSTFLSDGFFGNSLLLPNRNLAPAYQKIDLSARYSPNSLATLYTSLENLLSRHYQPVFGFPAAPFTFRTGIQLTLGGEAWGRTGRP
ncbi:MAG TPA: TonB-dependent receptor [Terriglobia bacterium]